MADQLRELVENAMVEWASRKGISRKWVSTWPVAAATYILGEVHQRSGMIEIRIPRDDLSGLNEEQVEAYVFNKLQWALRNAASSTFIGRRK